MPKPINDENPIKIIVEATATEILKDEITNERKRTDRNGYDVDLVRACINSGANVNEYMITKLYTCISPTYTREVRIKTPIVHQIIQGWSNRAATHAQSVMMLFLKAGVNLLAVDSYGNNSFHIFKELWPEELLELLKHVDEEQLRKGLSVKNNNLLLPWEIYAKAKEDCPYEASKLIEAVNALMPDNWSYTSADRNNFNCYTYYIEKEENYPQDLRVLVYAIRNNLRQVIDYHQQAGIYLHGTCDNDNNTLLDLAKKNGDQQLIAALRTLSTNQTGHRMMSTVRMSDVQFTFFADREYGLRNHNQYTEANNCSYKQ